MCDQTIPYTPGTWVWAKLVNRIWWPGKIVDESSIPKELEYYKKKNKRFKTAVYFESDKSYELIINLDKVFLYSCSKKMEFVEKGYLLYLKQKKSGLVTGGFDMTCFVEDVLNVERDIGGDTNVFNFIIKKQQNEENMKKAKININKLFISEKERRKRNKNKKRSLSSKPKLIVKTSSLTPTRFSGVRPIIRKSHTLIAAYHFVCPYCDDFSTTHFNLLKMHSAVHKNECIDNKNEKSVFKKCLVTKKSLKKKSSSSINTQACTSTPKKQRNASTEITSFINIKPRFELLKDWDFEDLDETISVIQSKDECAKNDSDLTKDTIA